MHKHILILIGLFSLYTTSFAQPSANKILFVIDSIPVITDPEEWNEITNEDIADARAMNNKDSLKLLGFGRFEGVTFIFTKEYRNRPDSLKRIPSLKQMELKEGVWQLKGVPYSGKYIDYYNSGRKMAEGMLADGKLNGEVKVLFQNGGIKSVNHYKDGLVHGSLMEYYKSGALKQKREYTDGKSDGVWESFFPNGSYEVKGKARPGNGTDTSYEYYSTGKIKKISIIKNGEAVKDPVIDNINYLQTKVYESFRNKQTKQALKYLDKILELDSLNETAHFYWGEILVQSSHYDEAIEEYDKALKIEPLYKTALMNRAFARIKKYEVMNEKALRKNKTSPSAITNDAPVPKGEQEKICTDLRRAIYLDADGKTINEAIAKYCQ
ncbi:MAG: tetratricopeptide repeat protein [Chitinophagaceae bacterium]